MALDSQKELAILKSRLKELADKSYRQNIYTFSCFLGLAEQDIFWQMEKKISYASYELWGGWDAADRKMIRFGNSRELNYEAEYPLVCVHIKPLSAKFADKLSHRDFLGALMNLGIDRSTLGDIRAGEKEGYLVCLDTIAEYICENLTKIKHTNVTCMIVAEAGEVPEEDPKHIEELVASERIDGIISKVYNISRNESLLLFQEKKVYVDGRRLDSNSRFLKAGETVNVRGFGKFVYKGIMYETKKGKLCVAAEVFG